MYRDMRYVLDRRHPLHPPAQVRALFLGFRLSYVIPKPVVGAVGMWESRRDFQRVWEEWEAGFMAFHAPHSVISMACFGRVCLHLAALLFRSVRDAEFAHKLQECMVRRTTARVSLGEKTSLRKCIRPLVGV